MTGHLCVDADIGGVSTVMKKMKFHYIKSDDHKEIMVDGAIGTFSASGEKFAASFYSERLAIPDLVVNEIFDNGEVGKELTKERVSKDGIVRIVSCTLHLDRKTAEGLRDLLNNTLAIWD